MKTIFVSSTFKDMHFERDALQRIAKPLINNEASKYGEIIDFCDLRWGIDTAELDSETGARKVLSVCLDEIDNCDPPMIVILGYRYGWIPDKGIIERTASNYSIELDSLEKSVTELEIEYGALSSKRSRKNTFFYFREIETDAPKEYLAESEEHQKRLEKLKKKIRDLSGGQLREYSVRYDSGKIIGVDEFAKMVVSDVSSYLKDGWERNAKRSSLQREIDLHRSFFKEKERGFLANRSIADEYLNKITGNEGSIIIQGETGTGKSSFMSYLASRLEENSYSTLALSSGITAGTANAKSILIICIRYLESKLNLLPFFDGEYDSLDIEKLSERYVFLCKEQAKREEKVAILIDAADQLSNDEARQNFVFVPRYVSDSLKFVMTCTEDIDLPYGSNVAPWQVMNKQDKKMAIEGILERYRRELSNNVKSALENKMEADNPLYLSLLINRLVMMNKDDFDEIRQDGDDMKAINKRQLGLIDEAPEGLNQMSVNLFEEVASRIDYDSIIFFAKCIAFSRYGLRKDDLKRLIGEENWKELDFIRFVHYINDCFIVRDDGRYDFIHKCLREGLREKYKSEKQAIEEKLAIHFLSLDSTDTVRSQEIAYHLIEADKKNEYLAYCSEKTSISKRYSAIDTASLCKRDDCKWLGEIYQLCQKLEEEKLETTLDFFANQLFSCFGEEKESIDTKIKAIVSAFPLLKGMKESENVSILESCALSYIELGNACITKGQAYSYIDGCTSYEHAILYAKRAEELAEEKRDVMAECYRCLGNAYSLFDNKELSFASIEYYKKSIEYSLAKSTREASLRVIELYLLISCEYIKLSQIDMATRMCKNAENVLQIIKDQLSSKQYQLLLAEQESSYAMVVQASAQEIETGEGAIDSFVSTMNTAIEYRQSAISILEGVIAESLNGDYDTLRKLAKEYTHLAMIIHGKQKFGESIKSNGGRLNILESSRIPSPEETRKEIEPIYEKGLAIYERLVNELGSERAQNDLMSYQMSGVMLQSGNEFASEAFGDEFMNQLQYSIENGPQDEYTSCYGFDEIESKLSELNDTEPVVSDYINCPRPYSLSIIGSAQFDYACQFEVSLELRKPLLVEQCSKEADYILYVTTAKACDYTSRGACPSGFDYTARSLYYMIDTLRHRYNESKDQLFEYALISCLYRVSMAFRSLGHYDDELKLLKEAKELCRVRMDREKTISSKRDFAVICSHIAYVCTFASGDEDELLNEALDSSDQTIKICDELKVTKSLMDFSTAVVFVMDDYIPVENPLSMVLIFVDRADIYSRFDLKGKASEALSYCLRAKECMDEVRKEASEYDEPGASPIDAIIFYMMGKVCWLDNSEESMEQAYNYYCQAVATMDELYDEYNTFDGSYHARMYIDLGMCCGWLGRNEESDACFEKAISLATASCTGALEDEDENYYYLYSAYQNIQVLYRFVPQYYQSKGIEGDEYLDAIWDLQKLCYSVSKAFKKRKYPYDINYSIETAEESIELLYDLIQRYNRSRDVENASIKLYQTAGSYMDLRMYEKAIEMLNESLALYESLGVKKPLESNICERMTIAYSRLGTDEGMINARKFGERSILLSGSIEEIDSRPWYRAYLKAITFAINHGEKGLEETKASLESLLNQQ